MLQECALDGREEFSGSKDSHAESINRLFEEMEGFQAFELGPGGGP